MIHEVTDFPGLSIYTLKGMYTGRVENVVLDVENNKISGLTVTHLNEKLVSGATKIIVPYRWVSTVGDVILLRYFPEHVTLNSDAAIEDDESPDEIG